MKRLIKKLFFWLNTAALMGAAMVGASGHDRVYGFNLFSRAAVLACADTGEILFGKNAHRTMYPASTTKVMTALLLIEYADGTGWDEMVVITENAVESIGSTAANIGLRPGDTLTLGESLYAIMLASANEVTIAAAEHVAGSVEAFVCMMNRRAYEIGAHRTHFVNPTGLPAALHTTTAADTALIMREALKKEDFLRAISLTEYTIFPNNGHPLTLRNRNLLIQDGQFFSPHAVGGKTGFTRAAGNTLVNYAIVGGERYITVVLGAPRMMTNVDTVALLGVVVGEPYTIPQTSWRP